jgi:hypothetical protein
MSEKLSLSEMLEKTMLDYFADNGGGFPMGFLAIVDFAAESGENRIIVAKQQGQPTVRSMGLAAYLDTWYKDDAQRTWASLTRVSCDCDDCRDDDEDE